MLVRPGLIEGTSTIGVYINRAPDVSDDENGRHSNACEAKRAPVLFSSKVQHDIRERERERALFSLCTSMNIEAEIEPSPVEEFTKVLWGP